MNIAIIGTGYVGLVTAAGFAGFGHQVIALDVDEERIKKLQREEMPFFEPGLHDRVQHYASRGTLRFTTSYSEAVERGEVGFLGVGTPATASGGSDLSAGYAATNALGEALAAANSRNVLILSKSTVVPGTSRRIHAILCERLPQGSFEVAANPEFLQEGVALAGFDKPDRVVVGFHHPASLWAAHRVVELYRPIVLDTSRILDMDAASAELSKYAANGMLATRISYMNELSRYAETIGADIKQVQRVVGSDARIGPAFLHAGASWGGSCFGKDLCAITAGAREKERPLTILEAAGEANHRQRAHVLEKIRAHFSGSVEGKTIAVWGLAFKPGTDDVRDAPALDLVEGLLDAGARVRAYDPRAMQPFLDALVQRGHQRGRVELMGLHCALDMYDAARGADALLLVTEWHEFRAPDFARLKGDLAAPVLFDGRNIWDGSSLRAMGFTWHGIGRPR